MYNQHPRFIAIQFQCVTPEKWGGSIKSVVVSSNGQTYSTLEFRYSSQLTPALTSISPTQGDSGDNVTINGTLLDPDNMMVWVGAAECTDITGSEDMVGFSDYYYSISLDWMSDINTLQSLISLSALFSNRIINTT